MLSVLVLVAVFCLALAAILTWWLSRSTSPLQIVDRPNERSLHTIPRPRTGGVAMLTSILIGGSIIAASTGEGHRRVGWLGGAVLVLAAISLVDDRFGLPAGVRLSVHLLVAAVLVASGFVVDTVVLPGLTLVLPEVAATVITILFISWMMNLYNFMDGMDGFAAGMAVVGFGTLGSVGIAENQWLFSGMNLIVASAAAGFLIFNFPPARIFMGDVGSVSLGLLAAAFSIWGEQIGLFPLWVAVLAFSPFIVDATVTLLLRALTGKQVWRAHKDHYYQRVVDSGWSHRRTVLLEYVLMMACAFSAFFAVQLSGQGQWALIGFWVVGYLILALSVRTFESARRRQAVDLEGSSERKSSISN